MVRIALFAFALLLPFVLATPAWAPTPLVAVDDAYSVDEDHTLSVDAAAGVLANDSGAVSAAVDTEPAHGSLDMHSDGSFTYEPDADFYGADHFHYLASDGTNQEEARVDITVDPVEDPPVAVDDAYSTPGNVALVVSSSDGVLHNDLEVDGDTLEVVHVHQPQHGSVDMWPSGRFAYVPDANWNGTDHFHYWVSDGTSEDEGQVVISVTIPNRPPVLSSIGSRSTDWASLLTFTATAYDPDGQALRFSLVSAPSGATIGQTSGAFSWTPTSAQIGTYQFGVRVSDTGTPVLTDEETVQITVERRPTVLTSDTHTIQFSDWLHCDAALKDAGTGAPSGTPISGADLRVALEDHMVQGVTAADGWAEMGMVAHAPKGSWLAPVTFAGSALYEPATSNHHVTITREDAAIELVRGRTITIHRPFSLTARVMEAPDGRPGGLLSMVRVRFAAFGGDDGPFVRVARVQVDGNRGLATVSMNLKPGTYTLRVRFLHNPYYVTDIVKARLEVIG